MSKRRKTKYQIAGIYMLYCTANRKMYIGSSLNINDRFKNHSDILRWGSSRHRLLRMDVQAYGYNSIEFHLVKRYPTSYTKEQLREIEELYIRKYQTTDFDKGYNILSPLSSKEMGENKKALHFFNKKGHEIIVINTDDKTVSEYAHCGEAAKMLGLKQNKVWEYTSYWKGSTTTRGKSWKGYIFIQKNSYDTDFDYINYKKPRAKKEPPVKIYKTVEEYDIKRCAVEAMDSNGEVRQYCSYKQCIETLGLNKTKFYKCIKAEPGKYTHHGYQFRRI